MRSRGFSIVELTIVIVVMAILTALVMAGLRQSAISARNEERRTNAKILARGLESYHKKVDNRFIEENEKRPDHRYPSAEDVLHALGFKVAYGYDPDQVNAGKGYPDSFLTGVPGRIVSEMRLMHYIPLVSGPRPGDATDVEATTEEDNASGIPLGDIVYQPLIFRPETVFFGTTVPDRIDACISSQDVCTSFNLYYKVETFDGDIEVETITSEFQ